MIRIALPLALALLAAGPAASAEPSAARARANLASLFSDGDYPAEAVRNREQGAVAFRLSVGADGSATGCTVTGSSGSAILDSTTCNLLMARARFEPARDAAGKPTVDTYTGRIIWRLPDDEPPPPHPALLIWMLCVGGEAAKLAPGDLPPAEVARRAFLPCKAQEAIVAPDPERARLMAERRVEFERMIETTVAEARAELKTAGPVPLDALQREFPR